MSSSDDGNGQTRRESAIPIQSRSGRQPVEGQGPEGRGKAGASQKKKRNSEERGRGSYTREEEVRRASDATMGMVSPPRRTKMLITWISSRIVIAILRF